MPVAIDWDLPDFYIAQPAFSASGNISDPRLWAKPEDQSTWFAPNALGIILRPTQLTSQWATTPGKWQLSDFACNAAQWEQQAHRSVTDWFLASRGLPDGSSVATAQNISRNAGLFLEFFAFVPPHADLRDVIELSFGGRYILHVHSDGTADLEDTLLPAGADWPATDVSLSDTEINGKFVQIMVLPWRRGRILISCSLGGWFEVYVGAVESADSALVNARAPGEVVYYTTLPAAGASIRPNPACRAFFQLSVLRYPASAILTSVDVPLASTVVTVPDDIVVRCEQQDGARAVIALMNSDGTLFAPTAANPASAFQWQLTLTSPSTYVTPAAYFAQASYNAVALARSVSPITLPAPHHVSISIDADRGMTTAHALFDNPAGSLDALSLVSNTRTQFRLLPASNIGIVQTIFEGYTDRVVNSKGLGQAVQLQASGLRKRLRTQTLMPGQSFDGWLHTDCVQYVLQVAGVANASMLITADPGNALDASPPGESPLWQPAGHATCDMWIRHICTAFSGWIFQEINGVFVYAPPEQFRTIPAMGIPAAQTIAPSYTAAPAGSTIGTKFVAERTEPRANDIRVYGRDWNGDLIAAQYVDTDSIANPSVANYVGERRSYTYFSGSIATDAMAARVLGILVAKLTPAIQRVHVRIVDFSPAFGVGNLVNVIGYGIGIMTGIQVDFSSDLIRPAELKVELL